MDSDGQRTRCLQNLLLSARIFHQGDTEKPILLVTPLRLVMLSSPTASGGYTHHAGKRHPRYSRQNNLSGIAPWKNWGNGKHHPHPLCLAPTGSSPVPTQTPQCTTHDSYRRVHKEQEPGISIPLSLPSSIWNEGHIQQHWCHHTAPAAGNGTNNHEQGSDWTITSTSHHPTTDATKWSTFYSKNPRPHPCANASTWPNGKHDTSSDAWSIISDADNAVESIRPNQWLPQMIPPKRRQTFPNGRPR